MVKEKDLKLEILVIANKDKMRIHLSTNKL